MTQWGVLKKVEHPSEEGGTPFVGSAGLGGRGDISLRRGAGGRGQFFRAHSLFFYVVLVLFHVLQCM